MTTDLFDYKQHNYTRICRELRKLGKIERERMRKGNGYTTWADRGAEAIEHLQANRTVIKQDGRALEQAIEMLKESDQKRYEWKVNFYLLLAVSICTVLVYISYNSEYLVSAVQALFQ